MRNLPRTKATNSVMRRLSVYLTQSCVSPTLATASTKLRAGPNQIGFDCYLRKSQSIIGDKLVSHLNMVEVEVFP